MSATARKEYQVQVVVVAEAVAAVTI